MSQNIPIRKVDYHSHMKLFFYPSIVNLLETKSIILIVHHKNKLKPYFHPLELFDKYTVCVLQSNQFNFRNAPQIGEFINVLINSLSLFSCSFASINFNKLLLLVLSPPEEGLLLAEDFPSFDS